MTTEVWTIKETGKFAAFCRVTSGMDVVDAINKVPVENEKPVRIKTMTVQSCTASPSDSK